MSEQPFIYLAECNPAEINGSSVFDFHLDFQPMPQMSVRKFPGMAAKAMDLIKSVCKAGIAGNSASSAYVMRQMNVSSSVQWQPHPHVSKCRTVHELILVTMEDNILNLNNL